jgi:hypothetical protein
VAGSPIAARISSGSAASPLLMTGVSGSVWLPALADERRPQVHQRPVGAPRSATAKHRGG